VANILLIETATKLCSVGLAVDGDIKAIREDTSDRYSHAEKTNFFIEEVCHESGVLLKGIDAIAVGAGPGSYTGLRIGTSIAKGLCFALDIPLIGISSLHVIAQGMLCADQVSAAAALVPMIDARRNEVFACVLDQELNELRATAPLILDKEGYDSLGVDTFAAGGDGAEKIEVDTVQVVRGITTSTQWMATLAESRFAAKAFSDLAYFVPRYGKAANAIKPKPWING